MQVRSTALLTSLTYSLSKKCTSVTFTDLKNTMNIKRLSYMCIRKLFGGIMSIEWNTWGFVVEIDISPFFVIM